MKRQTGTPLRSLLEHKFVFVAGLHRSGTSLLHRCLRDHPQISGFRDAGVPEDEGQHLQTVLPRGGYYGGPGRFGRHPEAHMTEAHPLASPETAEALWRQWSPHWDLTRQYLVEKTPISLLRTRFLQALFPNSWFVVIVRHPGAVALATLNALASFGAGADLTVVDQIDHWLLCHRMFAADSEHIRRLMLVRYEKLVHAPIQALDSIFTWLGLPAHSSGEHIEADRNDEYFEQWRCMRKSAERGEQVEEAMALEEEVRHFGYSLADWHILEAPLGFCGSLRETGAAG